MRTLLAVAMTAALAWTGGAALADEGSPCHSTECADLDGNGQVNIVDVLIVTSNFGNTAERNPCVEYAQPAGEVEVWGTMQVPAGPLFLVPAEHPAYQPLREGTPWPALRVCS